MENSTTIEKIQVKPGIYENVPFDTYLSWDCFSKSMVKSALISTAHLHHYINNGKKQTKEMALGSLLDCMLLEPEIFADKFAEKLTTYPDDPAKKWSGNSHSCRAWLADKIERGIVVYSRSDYEKCVEMIGNIADHETANKWINDGKNQVSIVWEDHETGIMCKSRIDVLKEDMLTDLKSTVNASPSEFKRTLNNFGYHIQNSMYSEGYAQLNGGEVLPFGFVVVESEAPHCVATYKLDEEALIIGNSMFRRAINRYVDYKKMGPVGYSKLEQEISIPQWAVNVEDSIDE